MYPVVMTDNRQTGAVDRTGVLWGALEMNIAGHKRSQEGNEKGDILRDWEDKGKYGRWWEEGIGESQIAIELIGKF